MSYQSVFRADLFKGQTVIVTGGGSGIGRCTAHELSALGAHVALVGRRVEKLGAVAAEIARGRRRGERSSLRHPRRGGRRPHDRRRASGARTH